jgi:hypothetical protein
MVVAAPLEMVTLRQAGQWQAAFGYPHLRSEGNKSADHDVVAVGMASEDGKGIVMAGVADSLPFGIQVALFHGRSSEMVNLDGFKPKSHMHMVLV